MYCVVTSETAEGLFLRAGPIGDRASIPWSDEFADRLKPRRLPGNIKLRFEMTRTKVLIFPGFPPGWDEILHASPLKTECGFAADSTVSHGNDDTFGGLCKS